MDLIGFVQEADPQREARVGALLDDGRTVIDLQAAHFAMYEAPHPALRDLAALREHRDVGVDVARRVVDWAASQRPPGVATTLERVRVLDRLKQPRP